MNAVVVVDMNIAISFNHVGSSVDGGAVAIKVVSPSLMITSPAMVSSDVAESMVIKRKLFPWSILIERIESAAGTSPMICCAETA